jgi:signal transduction histidine kinase
VVLARDEQLVRVLSNLLSNALKFRSARPPAITVSARPVPEGWVVSVADNGIGMSAEDAHEIFTMFRRLHSREEYEGCGIGLALVERIVRRLGGRTWVVSQPGAGATFHILLPRVPDLAEDPGGASRSPGVPAPTVPSGSG